MFDRRLSIGHKSKNNSINKGLVLWEKNTGTPVIAITGWGEHPGALATEAQADIVLEKPIELPELDGLVTELLKKNPNNNNLSVGSPDGHLIDPIFYF